VHVSTVFEVHCSDVSQVLVVLSEFCGNKKVHRELGLGSLK
jgi:hypothetical protein